MNLQVKDKKYRKIIAHYERCFKEHGDNHLGADWPKVEDVDVRYKVMLDVVREKKRVKLLDFGCGASGLFEYIQKTGMTDFVEYSGLDLSKDLVEFSEKKFSENEYYCVDLIDEPDAISEFDYVVMNGVFTEKQTLTFDEMFDYFKILLPIVFEKAKRGISFNVMSKIVDWERDDLFHLPLDLLMEFLVNRLSRHVVIRNDYGLYEYAAYVYKQPSRK